MFIYELLMLKIPYDGSASLTGSNINIRSHVLSGGRPPLTTKVHSLYLLAECTIVGNSVTLLCRECWLLVRLTHQFLQYAIVMYFLL